MENPSLNNKRKGIIEKLKSTQFDLLVIGGGITGAGIALDAQSRGMKTALIEMNDFASGTSSRSTKLVHGGLRYLKQLELKLVAEVGKERAIVFNNGRHVTMAEVMLLPLIRKGSIGYIGAWAGMMLYDILAGVKKKERRKILTREETLAREPLLNKDLLIGGVSYYEYRTDDARLTIEVLKEASAQNALVVNYTKAENFIYNNGQICGIIVTDVPTGKEYKIFATKIVNASGPWVDEVDMLNDKTRGGKLFLTKGVHIVIDHTKLPIQQALYFDAPDRRMVFAIPRGGKVYIGTTDTSYTGSIDEPAISGEDRAYLINAINFIFPKAGIGDKDIESGWVWLRPLIRQPGKSPSAISRKDEIFQYPSGLISIAGGKLTGYRKMAERVVNLVAVKLKKEKKLNFASCTTGNIKISGGNFQNKKEYDHFILSETRIGEGLGLTNKGSEVLVKRYGTNIQHIWALAKKIELENIEPEIPLFILLQLLYGIESEFILTPSDFFIRRTGALYFDIAWVKQWKDDVIEWMSKNQDWSAMDKLRYAAELDKHIFEAAQ